MTPVKRPKLSERPIVLSIGTTEPFVSAGHELDILMADRLEVRPVAVIAGVSAQDGSGQFLLHAIPVQMVQAQLASFRDVPIAAVRIGAIPSRENITEIANFIRVRNVPAILDPVIATSAGGRLLDEDALDALQTILLPFVTLVTPNLAEAEALSGYKVAAVGEMDAAALVIVNNGAQAVYIKGGHLPDAPVDVFWDGTHLRHYEAPRIQGDMRGTGCALAMTMAAAMAHGHSVRSAIRAGREIVRHLIPLARTLGAVRVVP